jgi:dTDP-4-dehydrorhamnose reductase
MSRRRVLVIGARGMLGHKVLQTLADRADLELHATTRRALPPAFAPASVTFWPGLELSGGSAPLRGILEQVRPDVIVNAVGAIKQKDLAAAIDETWYLNASLPHMLALLNPIPCRVIHVSTDCVFDGTRGRYRDSDRPDAVDLYGRSKAAGEMDYGPHLTLRTSIIGFEIDGHLGLLSWFFRQPRGSRLKGFTNAIYSGVPTVTLSRVIADAIGNPAAATGLVHVASEPIDKYRLLTRVNDAFDLGHDIQPDDSLKIDRSLDDTRFRTATGTTRPGWTELVRELQADFASRPYADIYDGLRRAAASS